MDNQNSRLWVDMIHAIHEFRNGLIPLERLTYKLESAMDAASLDRINRQLCLEWGDIFSSIEVFVPFFNEDTLPRPRSDDIQILLKAVADMLKFLEDNLDSIK
jgi:hypothetical protein